VFSDPGRLLVRKATDLRIKVVPIPGASSLMPALTVSGFEIDQFVFFGFLSPKRNRRLTELQELKKERRTVVLLDAPYRLVQLVRDIAEVMGSSRRVCVAFDLTLPTEQVFHGTAPELFREFSRTGKKGEFVVVIESASK
jgi:16S rRNA (cytidine1402-2'-O)-methyltransferase